YANCPIVALLNETTAHESGLIPYGAFSADVPGRKHHAVLQTIDFHARGRSSGVLAVALSRGARRASRGKHSPSGHSADVGGMDAEGAAFHLHGFPLPLFVRRTGG